MTKLLKRSEVPVELTWNLKDLYPSIDDVYRDMDILKDKTKHLSIIDLDSKDSILNFLTKYEEIIILFIQIGTFIELNLATDHTNLAASSLAQKGQDFLAKIQTDLTIALDPLYQMDSIDLKTWTKDERYGAFLKQFTIKRNIA